MAWIERSEGIQQFWRILLLALLGITVMGTVYATSAAMTKLEEREMARVTGREGLSFVLQNFRIQGSQSLSVRESEFSGGTLSLHNLTLEEPSGDPWGDSGNGVTTGAVDYGTGNAITLDVAGSHNGFLVMELPNSETHMEPNDVDIERIKINGNDLGGLSIRNAQYAGGSRLSVGGMGSNGGLRTGLWIELDADIIWDEPNVGDGFRLEGLHGASNASGVAGNSATWSFSGPLRWADLTAGRPLMVNFFESNGNSKFILEFNPEKTSPAAGTIGVANAVMDRYYGEVVLNVVAIRNLQVTGPTATEVSSDLSTY